MNKFNEIFKKLLKFVILFVLVLTALFIAGCFKSVSDNSKNAPATEQANKSNSTDKAFESVSPTMSGEQNTKMTNLDKSALLTYHSAKLGFSITFPESWRNKYVVKDSESSAQVYQKSTYDASNGEMGRLVSIAVFTPEKWQAEGEEITSMSENYGSIKSKHAVYYFGGPSDVQFDPDNKQSAKEYTDMAKDISTLVKTISVDENR